MPQPASAEIPRAPRVLTLACRGAALALVAWFLASVGGFYQRETGFTALISFGPDHANEVPAMAHAPHHHSRAGGYDGRFYAQLALEPLLRDPAIDRALDNPPYRARRILFSWTAYLAGMGRPAWILQAYALQNVVAWLLLAWLLVRWVPPDTPRTLALWAACLFSQGLLASVRLALTDGPSLLVLAVAARMAEQGRVWTTSVILGVGALGRETNLFGLAMLPRPRLASEWLRATAALALAVVPLLLWQDYLWSIYRSTTFANQDLLSAPFTGLVQKWQTNAEGLVRHGWSSPHVLASAATLALMAQAAYIVIRRAYGDVWWRLAVPYVVLMCLLDWVAWGGFPGAATRVLLPLTVGFNLLLRDDRSRRFWWWYIAGNVATLYASLPLRG